MSLTICPPTSLPSLVRKGQFPWFWGPCFGFFYVTSGHSMSPAMSPSRFRLRLVTISLSLCLWDSYLDLVTSLPVSPYHPHVSLYVCAKFGDTKTIRLSLGSIFWCCDVTSDFVTSLPVSSYHPPIGLSKFMSRLVPIGLSLCPWDPNVGLTLSLPVISGFVTSLPVSPSHPPRVPLSLCQVLVPISLSVCLRGPYLELLVSLPVISGFVTSLPVSTCDFLCAPLGLCQVW